MQCIGIVAKIKQDKHVRQTVTDLVRWLSDRQIRPLLDEEIGKRLGYTDCLL